MSIYTQVLILIGAMAEVANNVPVEVNVKFRVNHLKSILGYMEICF